MIKKLIDIFSDRFSTRKIRPNSVLVIEPNPWHGEIVPGFVKYFQDMGYNVDVFLRRENNDENPFAKYPPSNLRIFVCTPKQLRKWCRHLDKYEHVFLSTSVFWDCGFSGLFQDWLGFEIKCRGRTLMVEHSPQVFLDKYNMRAYSDRILSLSEYDNIKQCNPHYFGEIESSKQKHSPTKFAIVGTIHPDAKNHNLLIAAARALMQREITDFHIFIIGRGHLDIPTDVMPHITMCGRMNYDAMFQTVSQCDFIIALLDPDNAEHARYRKGTTTGSLQLSLGFNKPMIINEQFAPTYGLTDKNAVIYAGNNLDVAMQTAIEMSDKKYHELTENLFKLHESVYNKSITNLKSALHEKEDQ